MAKRVTLQRVADRAKVSITAASLALADADRISDETKARVRRACKQLNYQRRQRRVRSDNDSNQSVRMTTRVGLAVITHHQSDEKIVETLQYVDRIAANMSIRIELVMIGQTDHETCIKRLTETAASADGILLTGHVDQKLVSELVDHKVQCVLLGGLGGEPYKPHRLCPMVCSDYMAMGYEATRRLIERGHRRIGFFCRELPRGLWYERWFTGFRCAHIDAELPIDPQLIHVVGMDPQHITIGEHVVPTVLKMKDPPTGFVFPDYGSAVSVMHEMAQVGCTIERNNVVIGTNAVAAQREGVADYPLVLEDYEQLARAALLTVRQITAGLTPGPYRTIVPFQMRNFD